VCGVSKTGKKNEKGDGMEKERNWTTDIYDERVVVFVGGVGKS